MNYETNQNDQTDYSNTMSKIKLKLRVFDSVL